MDTTAVVRARALKRQNRILSLAPPMPASVPELFDEIMHAMSVAFNNNLLTPHPRTLLRLIDNREDGDCEIVGGAIDSKLTGNRQFKRYDMAHFNFGLIVDASEDGLMVTSYRFHIQFPETAPTRLIRFDLNSPDLGHDPDVTRCHLHVNTNDETMLIPSALLSPVEILDILIYGLEGTGRKRAH